MTHFLYSEQLDEEFQKVIDLVLYVFGSLGFENFTANFFKRQETGRNTSTMNWKKQRMLLSMQQKDKIWTLLLNMGSCFLWSEVGFMVKCLGRQWQLGTIQVDYNLPERFD
jgi:threonyl-tRNA synthetase